MEQEKLKQEMAKTKHKAKQKENRNIFTFHLGRDGKKHSNESPYKAYLGDHVKMRSVMARLKYKMDKEENARRKSKENK